MQTCLLRKGEGQGSTLKLVPCTGTPHALNNLVAKSIAVFMDARQPICLDGQFFDVVSVTDEEIVLKSRTGERHSYVPEAIAIDFRRAYP